MIIPAGKSTVDIEEIYNLAKSLSNEPLEENGRFSSWLEKINEDCVDKLILFCLYQAIFRKASDIHFKPFEAKTKVMFRIQGELDELFSFKIAWYEQILRILKNWANLPSYKIESPQEGRLAIPFQNLLLYVRVSFFPTVLGEKVVCRILNFRDNLLTLDQLGMDDAVINKYKELLLAKKGMIIICGPAGSGKTTTLYASLLWLAQNARNTNNISTIEDPVEYIIEEFNQTQVNSSRTLTFAEGLKCLLRQDPNILAVGEIRDTETALTALQAGLTGHLIFTTLHAHGTEGALKRLQEFGALPSTINMSLIAVLYQQLIPRACDNCKGGGCELCKNKGFKGMTGKFEFFTDFEI